MMVDSLIALTLIIASLGAGLMAGVYFAFSAFMVHANIFRRCSELI